VAVFLKEIKGPSDRWAEADRIALAAANILNDTGAVIHAMPYGRQSRVWATLG